MDEASIAARALTSPRGQHAVLHGDTGTVLRVVREALGWSQTELGRRTDYSQVTISRLERGEGRITDVGVLHRLADALSVPPSVLGVADQNTPPRPAVDGGTVSDVKRAEFLRAVAGAATALALPRVVTEDVPGHVDAATVRECRAALGRLYELDNRFGGSGVYPIAVRMVEQLQNTLRHASFSPATGAGLREITAASAEHVGWLAFDAGRNDRARHWWLEALHLTDVGGTSQDARVTALTSMARQAADSPNPAGGREALELIGAARRSLGSNGTPRLLSLLAARDALGHAHAGDRGSAIHAVSTAERLMDPTPAPDDPAWLAFWGPADLAYHRTNVAFALGDLADAEQATRTALAHSDEVVYPRNHLGYTNDLGHALARTGKLEESIAVTTPVVTRMGNCGSARIRSDLGDTLRVLDRYRSHRQAQQFTAWSRRILGAA